METIHQFDSALRAAFEAGGQDQGVVFLQRDPGNQIIPCSPNKILLSRITTLRPGGRLLPVGFSTNAATTASIAQIDAHLLAADPDPNTITYILPLTTIEQVIDSLSQSLTMDNGREFDFNALRAAAAYLATNNPVATEIGQVACLVRRGRTIPKLRPDDRLQNAPERQQDHIDLQPVRGNRPALFLFKVNGQAVDGWNGQDFYWPVLIAPTGIQPVIFTAETGD
jgi:hypothetical protein